MGVVGNDRIWDVFVSPLISLEAEWRKQRVRRKVSCVTLSWGKLWMFLSQEIATISLCKLMVGFGIQAGLPDSKLCSFSLQPYTCFNDEDLK